MSARSGRAGDAARIDMPALPRGAARRFDFDAPRPLEELLRWSIEQLEHGIVQMANPRYFGLFNPGANFPAQCADRIAGAFNPQLASSASSPVPVAIESHVIRAVARRAGLRRGRHRAFHDRRLGGELHLAGLRADRRSPALRARRRARLRRARCASTPRANVTSPGSRSRTRPASAAARCG